MPAKSNTHTLDYVDRANRYMKAVLSGKQPVCKLTLQTIERQKRDLAASKKRTFPYKFDRDTANAICEFAELMPHTKGRWAAKGETLRLEDWQCFELTTVFGWLHKKKINGINPRRFRRAYSKTPRKSGKSAKAAAIGNFMFVADGEYGSEVYCGATNEKQAMEVFKPAKIMVNKRPDLIDHFGVDVRVKNMNTIIDGSKFEPVIGKPGDGASPHCAIVDEYHEHDTPDQLDTFETGMGARDQPLLYVITTAGDNIGGPCYELEMHGIQVLEGTLEDDELFVLIYGIDPEDDWQSEIALIKANPNMGVSVSREYLLSQQRQAIQRPSKRGPFKTKQLNAWVGARDAYFDMEKWKQCFNPDISLEALQGEECLEVLDLASKVDLCAKIDLFPIGEGKQRRYRVLGDYYVPESALEDENNAHYRQWAEAGWLTVTPGNITDYEYIEEDLIERRGQVQINDVAYDPFQATQLATRMSKEGFPMTEYPNTVKNMSEPMKQLAALIIDGKIEHDGNPITAWCLSNVVAKEDKKENVFPNKNTNDQKIDGAVALIMGIGRDIAMMADEDQQSYLNDGDLLILN